MAKFKLAFGIHNHQPVGNFEAVFEAAHRDAYLPFLQMVERYPQVRLSLHQSGILWQWQKQHHSDFFQLVGRLVDSGQVELMTGGYYEPILASVPARDARGQIDMLTKYLHRHFGTTSPGLWLTERIWEPHLPSLLSKCGVSFVPIDDTHFMYAGFRPEQLTGPYVTEDEGKKITLLPIQKRLRYLVPFGRIEKLIDELKRQADRDPEGMAVYADDGEKFGVWPETKEHCYDEGWLEKFFEALSENEDWLEMIPLGEAAKEDAVGRAYLPTASYAEMLQWALPAEAFSEYEEFEHWLKQEGQQKRFGRFVRGSHWRGFLAKYDESNLMHKKMIDVSDRLEAYSAGTNDAEKTEGIRDRLYAGQCNCPYWHGVFGGLYLPHIRQAVYANLIEADARLRALEGVSGQQLEVTDYDADGHDEIVCRNDDFTAVVRPHQGGTLHDLSLTKHAFSVTDTLTRRHEGYHNKLSRAVTQISREDREEAASIHDLVLAKEEGLSRFLVEDWYLKRCFIDHFFAEGVSFDEFNSGQYGEDGDFIVEPYEYDLDAQAGEIRLSRRGYLWRASEVIPLFLVKTFRFGEVDNRLEVEYRLSTTRETGVTTLFGVENNFNFQAGHAEDRFVMVDGARAENGYLDSAVCHDSVVASAMVDQYRDLAVALVGSRPGSLWRLPIFTVSLSEGGFERVYQGTTLLHVYPVEITPKPLTIRLSLLAGSLSEVLGAAFPQKVSV